MKTTLAAAAIAAMLAATPALAFNGTGLDFYNTCGTPMRSGVLHPGICHGEVVGVADGLISAHLLCPGASQSATTLMGVVQGYMRSHTGQLAIPADAMIRNSLISTWPCRRRYRY